jgi:hypothetical protein
MSARFASRFMAGLPPSELFQDQNIKTGIFQDRHMAQIIPELSLGFGLFLAEAIEPYDFGAFAWLGGFFGGRFFRRFGIRHRESR